MRLRAVRSTLATFRAAFGRTPSYQYALLDPWSVAAVLLVGAFEADRAARRDARRDGET